jgi:hypothetical protein
MQIKAVAISSFAKFILGGLVFAKIKDIVEVYNNSELSGDQKREAAFKDIHDIGYNLTNWAVNLGIELAVAYFSTIK